MPVNGLINQKSFEGFQSLIRDTHHQFPHIMSRFVVEIMKIIEATEVKFLVADTGTMRKMQEKQDIPLAKVGDSMCIVLVNQ